LISWPVARSLATRLNLAASMEIGALVVDTTRWSGSLIAEPFTWTPVPPRQRPHAWTKFARYRSVSKDTTSAPSRPGRISCRQGRRAKMSGDGQGTCRKNPTG
jgi:hypothetical protein